MAKETPNTKSSNPKTNDERLALLKSRLALSKSWSKKPHEAMKVWVREYNIDDFGDTDQIRDKVRIGYIFRKTEQDISAIFDDQPELFFKGKKPNIQDIEPLFLSTYDWLWDVQGLEEKIEDAALYFKLLGLGFIESPYVTKTKKQKELALDQNGQPTLDANGQPIFNEYEVPVIDRPDARVIDPFKLWFSPETKFAPILDYEHCPYYIEEMVMTPAEVKSKFGITVESNESLKLDEANIEDQNGIDRNRVIVKDDLKRVTVYKYYGCLPEDLAKDIKDTEWTYDKDYKIFFTTNDELKVEECEYDTKPLFPVGNYGLANKFWKFGDAKHLMPLVQELQLYRSQILEHTRKMANPKPLIPVEATIDKEVFNNPDVGTPVLYEGGIPPSYLSPAQLGREVEVGIAQVRTDMEKESSSFDLMGGGGSSQVKTPRGIQVFSEAADRNTRRQRKKLARLIRQIIIFQFKQIAANWKPDDNHTLDVISDGKPETVQVTSEVLQVLGDPDILSKLDIEVESLSVNKVQMKQDALDFLDLALKNPIYFNMTEVIKYVTQNAFSMKDGDRYLATPEQIAQASKPQPEPPKVNVSIKADASTPVGAQILENDGVLPQGTAQGLVAQGQQIADQVTNSPVPPELGQPMDQGGANGQQPL